MISAKVIADSKNEHGNRITTMVLTFPRYILAELNTHRMMSRNSASSRAIPFEKLLKSVQENPFIPIAWMKDHKGMQGTEYFTGEEYNNILDFGNQTELTKTVIPRKWLEARDNAVRVAKQMSDYGITKQLVNRLLEPFMWHTVIVTATEWENFFALRCPQYKYEGMNYRSIKDLLDNCKIIPNVSNNFYLKINKGQADIHMMALAEAMWDAYNESTPKDLKPGEWHLPYGDNVDAAVLQEFMSDADNATDEIMNEKLSELRIKIAVARCARVSYTVVGEEGKPDNYENDIKLHDRLAESGHWSPMEHCAKAMNEGEYKYMSHRFDNFPYNSGWSGNFRGFIQYRKTFQNENITK